MLGLNAKINGARAKRRPAACSAGLSAQHVRLQRQAQRPRPQADRFLERQSRACLPAKTGQRRATGASKNVSVRTDLDPVFSVTYRFFNCTLVSVRTRVAPPQSDPRQTAGAARPSGLSCRAATSNRDTKRLELYVTRRKQTIPLTSNRDKTRVFQGAFQKLKSGDWRPEETDRAVR